VWVEVVLYQCDDEVGIDVEFDGDCCCVVVVEYGVDDVELLFVLYSGVLM